MHFQSGLLATATSLLLTACARAPVYAVVADEESGEHSGHVLQIGVEELRGAFTRDGDFWVSPPIEAGDGATRVAIALDLAVDADPAALGLQARTFDTDTGGPWLPLTVVWFEEVFAVAITDLEDVAAAVQIRVPEDSMPMLVSLGVTGMIPESAAVEGDIGAASNTVEQGLDGFLADAGVHPRSSWGARASQCSSNDSAKQRVAIHHTVTPSTPAGGSMQGRLRQIQSFHMDARNYCDVGYTFLVTVDGRLWEGRPYHRVGAHTLNNNVGTAAISFVGCFHASDCASMPPNIPPNAPLSSAGALAGVIARRHGFSITNTSLRGHRDFPNTSSTSCPGDHLRARLGTIRDIARGGPPPSAPPSAPPPPAPPAPPPAPKSYSQIVGDFDGNGTDDIATISKDGLGSWRDWVAMELSSASGFSSTEWDAATPLHMRNGNSGRNYQTLVGDFNGDGKSDLATISKDGSGGWRDWVAMELSTGSAFTSQTWLAATPLHMRNGNNTRTYATTVGDFNGDGLDDIATVSKDGSGGWRDWVALELSTGSGFTSVTWAAATPLHMRNGAVDRRYDVRVGDFNGDGKSDIATISKDGSGGWRDWLAMELSTGSGFTSHTWSSPTPLHMRNGVSTRSYAVLVGDVSGDGSDDIVTLSANASGGWRDWASVDVSTGTGFTSSTWAMATPLHMRNGGSNADYRVHLGDLDGDGKKDLVTMTRNAGGGWAQWAAVELSTGSGFTSSTWLSPTPQHMRNGGAGQDYRVLLVDVDGDGRKDLATLSRGGIGGWRDWASVDVSTGTSFNAATRAMATPLHMRNGG